MKQRRYLHNVRIILESQFLKWPMRDRRLLFGLAPLVLILRRVSLHINDSLLDSAFVVTIRVLRCPQNCD